RLTAADEDGNTYPVIVDIPADAVLSGALAFPECEYEDDVLTVKFGSATLSSCAKITVSEHNNAKVSAELESKSTRITTKIRTGSTREYADSYVSVGAPALERAREDLVIWTKDAAVFTIDSSESSGGSSGGGGSSLGGGIKSFPTGSAVIVPPVQENTDISLPDNPESKASFEDCEGHWAEADISYMYSKGYVNGMSDTLFAPDAKVTRAEFAAMTVRLLGLEQAEYAGAFADVKSDDWYAQSVETAYKAGIIQGSEGYFRPDDSITREEMAVILMRVYRINSQYESSAAAEFADSGEISPWAKEAVASAVELGLVNGVGENRFAPADNTTRAQAATVLKRLLETEQVKED
ncbi:MAG: S-layer homology domain-containing protein, partial [Clostridia bacterium]|nr:S-layer homology domain-containing protein [Clostridia bacterium]